MLFMSLAGWFGTISVTVLAITALIVAFVIVADHQVTSEHDPERANRLLMMKLRAPSWKYHAVRIGRMLTR